MSANDIQSTGVQLPHIAHVDARFPDILVITWADGQRVGRVDAINVSPIINTYKIFRPLRKNEALFEAARVSEDRDSIVWDDNDDLELSAEALEELAEQTMAPDHFVAFMQRNGLTEEGVATILGYSRRQIGYFKTTGPIPRVVALACRGFEAEKREQAVATKMREAIEINAAERAAIEAAMHDLAHGLVPPEIATQEQPTSPKPKRKVA
jgi:hypothetical protein